MTASNAPDIGISIMKEQDYHLENVTFKKIEDKVNHRLTPISGNYIKTLSLNSY
ncbi:hypothetical protein K4O60_11620 [Staphylococcus epidermidis]|nr:hypothetical protein [Staphylococcus epidermidis]